MAEILHSERIDIPDVDERVRELGKELEQLLSVPSFSQRELDQIGEKVWDLLENKEVRRRLHNPEALRNLKLSKEERKRRGIKNGLLIPGGGLSCIAGFGIFRALIEKKLLQNIDEVIASSGGAWVAAYGLAALTNPEMIRVGVSVFARDLRNHLFLNTRISGIVKRIVRKMPLADLQRVSDLCAGEVIGRAYKPPKDEKRPNTNKKLNTASLLEANCGVGFNISVTEVETGQPNYLRPEELGEEGLLDGLYASSSTPTLIGDRSPVINGKECFDGDSSARPVERFKELKVNSFVVSLNKPMRRALGSGVPKILEKLVFSGQEHSKVFERGYNNIDVNYLISVLQMIEFGKTNCIYVFEPEPKDQIKMSDIKDRSHKKLYNLYSKLYRTVLKEFNKNEI